jgi:cell division protein FtsB
MDFLGRRSKSMSRMPAQVPWWRQHLLKILAGALLALGVHDVFGAHGYLAMRRSEKQIEELRGQIEKLNQENQQLAEHVSALKTDPETIEKIAREEMGLAKPGEMIFKMPAAADTTKPNQSPNSR